jgi:hypothetical protein
VIVLPFEYGCDYWKNRPKTCLVRERMSNGSSNYFNYYIMEKFKKLSSGLGF